VEELVIVLKIHPGTFFERWTRDTVSEIET